MKGLRDYVSSYLYFRKRVRYIRSSVREVIKCIFNPDSILISIYFNLFNSDFQIFKT